MVSFFSRFLFQNLSFAGARYVKPTDGWHEGCQAKIEFFDLKTGDLTGTTEMTTHSQASYRRCLEEVSLV